MATALHAPRLSLLAVFGRGFVLLERFAEHCYRATAMAREIEALNGLPDEAFAAQGRTRAEVFRSLASRYGYI